MDVDGEAVEEYDEGRDLRKKLDEITAALGETGDQGAAIVGYRGVLDYVSTDAAGPSESVGKVKEEAIYGLAKAYADSKRYVCKAPVCVCSVWCRRDAGCFWVWWA